MTQEFLAEILGVQRTTVTGVAGSLQDRGVISYQRGRIRVLDRTRLEGLACSCHAAVQGHFDRVLPGVYPAFDPCWPRRSDAMMTDSRQDAAAMAAELARQRALGRAASRAEALAQLREAHARH